MSAINEPVIMKILDGTSQSDVLEAIYQCRRPFNYCLVVDQLKLKEKDLSEIERRIHDSPYVLSMGCRRVDATFHKWPEVTFFAPVTQAFMTCVRKQLHSR